DCTKKLSQQTIRQGWPDHRCDVPNAVQPFWDSRSQLVVADGVIYKGLHIVIPPSMQDHMLKLIHQSHLGIVKSKQRARKVLYWPDMSSEIEQMVKNCAKCGDFQNWLPRQPLKPTETPDLPFKEVASDLFKFERNHYVLLVDYYSKFIEVENLKGLHCHGNGPQYSVDEFKDFSQSYGIIHETSSPHTPHSNGEAERAVQTVKKLVRHQTNILYCLNDAIGVRRPFTSSAADGQVSPQQPACCPSAAHNSSVRPP
ncbi:hypothetical protein HF521_009443, partial [Silurus meridionalis]